MRHSKRSVLAVLIIANVLFFCVLGFYQTTSAAPRSAQEPFANSVRQRAEMVELLREIKALISQQNQLLRSGKLRVVVDDRPAR